MGDGNEPEPTIEATKRCPECASDIRVEANVCPHCRHRFSGTANKTTLGTVLIIVVLVATVGGIWWKIKSDNDRAGREGCRTAAHMLGTSASNC